MLYLFTYYFELILVLDVAHNRCVQHKAPRQLFTVFNVGSHHEILKVLV